MNKIAHILARFALLGAMVLATVPALAQNGRYCYGSVTINDVMYTCYSTSSSRYAEAQADPTANLTGRVITLSDSVEYQGLWFVTKGVKKNGFKEKGIIGINLPSKLEYIDSYGLAFTTRLESITLPNSLKEIATYAFGGSAIERIFVPSSCHTVGMDAFVGCHNLKEAHFNMATNFGSNVHLFTDCPNLTEVSFATSSYPSDICGAIESNKCLTFFAPDFDKSKCTLVVRDGMIDDYKKFPAFQGFGNYKTMPDFDKAYGPYTYTWNSTGYEVAAQYGAQLQDVMLPTVVSPTDTASKVIGVRDQGFKDQTALTSVGLPKGYKSIGKLAFSGCTSLSNIALCDELLTINDKAFQGCTSLTEIMLPMNVSVLGAQVFSGCTNLADMTVVTNFVPVAGQSTSPFAGFTKSNCDLQVLDSQLANFKAASIWKGFKSYTAYTEERYDENFTYYLNSGSGTASVMGRRNKFLVGDHTIPSKVTFDGVTYTVTKIQSEGFANEKYLTSIVIPSSVTSVGTSAFSNSGIKSVSFGVSGNTVIIGMLAFQGCTSLEKVKLPSGLKVVDAMVFGNCTNLQEVDLPATTTTIKQSAFGGCTALHSLIVRTRTVPTTTAGTGTTAFPSGQVYLYGLHKNNWANSQAWKSVVKQIVEISNADAQFTDEFIFQDYDHSARTCALAGRPNRTYPTNLTLPSTDEYGDYDVTAISDYGFSEMDITTIELPATLTKIGYAAFLSTPLTQIDLPSSVNEIGIMAFSATKLTSLEIPEGVTMIPQYMVADCDELTTLVLPSTADYLSDHVVNNCTALTRLAIKATTPPNPLSQLFSKFDKSNCVLVVPQGTSSAYQAIWAYQGFKSIEEVQDNRTFSVSPFTYTVHNAWAAPLEVSVSEGNASYPSDLTLPSQVTYSGKTYAVTRVMPDGFVRSTELDRVTIPGSIKEIGDFAFDAMNITQLVLKEGVEKVGKCAFSDNLIKTMELPSTLKSVGYNAFHGNRFETVRTALQAPIDISTSSLNSRGKSINCYVPQETLWMFEQTSDWSQMNLIGYTDTIVGDMNGDGNLDANDVSALVSLILGNNSDNANADVNGDGKVDVSDVTALVSLILG